MGYLDVDAMLEQMTPQQFAEWRAADSLELDASGWRQTGTIASGVHNAGLLTRAVIAKVNVTERDLHMPEDYIPHHRRDTDDEPRDVAEDFLAHLEARYGTD